MEYDIGHRRGDRQSAVANGTLSDIRMSVTFYSHSAVGITVLSGPHTMDEFSMRTARTKVPKRFCGVSGESARETLFRIRLHGQGTKERPLWMPLKDICPRRIRIMYSGATFCRSETTI